MNTEFMEAIRELDENKTLQLADGLIAQGVPRLTIFQSLLDGLALVGEDYAAGEYFVADLIMSGLIFSEVMQKLGYDKTIEDNIHMLFATPSPDTIDVGKGIVSSYFGASGFATHDIGVDTTPEYVLSKLHLDKHNILCVSALDNEGFDTLKEMIELFKREGVRNKVTMLIGGNASDDICTYVGADHYSKTIYDTFSQAMDVVEQYLKA